MKKILVIDESSLFRDFLRRKLQSYGFDVAVAVNGLDGVAKLRNEQPDLIIMDYYLSRTSAVELLKQKKADPNAENIPVIMTASKIDRSTIIEVAKYNVRKFFNKPIKIDALLRTVSEFLNVSIEFDNTPCIVEAHFNEEILFIEIAQGLNQEKIDLLPYKIRELLDLYQVKSPKILIMMSSVDIGPNDSLKLSSLLTNIMEASKAKPRNVRVLTNSDFVRKYIDSQSELEEVEVTDALDQAMDGLLGRRAGSYRDARTNVVSEEFLQTKSPRSDKQESFQMRFEEERADAFDLSELEEGITISIVDDDFVIQELIRTAFSDTSFEVKAYDNGYDFVHSEEAMKSDLVFLDLMMPEMDGFQVLNELKEKEEVPPIIVLSALSKRETVVEALRYGVNSYMIKPLKPEWILKKAAEVLKVNF
ncbi:MAG: response regulator [Spirochaetes bacterium]|jgi:DNA-binding response OmpR family regulator|nr:response regulator [Spirochaetota bacterium]